MQPSAGARTGSEDRGRPRAGPDLWRVGVAIPGAEPGGRWAWPSHEWSVVMTRQGGMGWVQPYCKVIGRDLERARGLEYSAANLPR